MATVEGSSLSQLRQGCIPVRLLPRGSSNNNGGGNTNDAASYSTHRTNNGNAVDGDAMLYHKRNINQEDFGNDFVFNKSAGTIAAAAASSGLMHHKFAVIDGRRRTVQKTKYLGSVRKEDNEEDSNGCLDGLHEGKGKQELSTGVTGMNGSDKWEHGPYHEGAAMVITGSFNWTWSAATNNNENIILSNRPELVVPFSEQFEELWRKAW